MFRSIRNVKYCNSDLFVVLPPRELMAPALLVLVLGHSREETSQNRRGRLDKHIGDTVLRDVRPSNVASYKLASSTGISSEKPGNSNLNVKAT